MNDPMDQRRYVFNTQETIHYRFPTHANDLVMDRAEAETSEAFIVVLEPGEAPPLHVHDDAEQIFYILEGTGILQIDEPPQYYRVKRGDLVRIPPHTWHRIQSNSALPLRYLSIDCFVGGRPQDEPTWDDHVRTMCKNNGWDFDAVRGKRSTESS